MTPHFVYDALFIYVVVTKHNAILPQVQTFGVYSSVSYVEFHFLQLEYDLDIFSSMQKMVT